MRIATIHLLLDLDSDGEACDWASETLSTMTQRPEETRLVDWAHVWPAIEVGEEATIEVSLSDISDGPYEEGDFLSAAKSRLAAVGEEYVPDPEDDGDTSEQAEFWRQLAAGGVAKATAEYSGSDDEGWINSVLLYAADGRELANEFLQGSHPDSPLVRLVHDYAWDILEARHSGWENNEGGQGEVTFDVAAHTALLHHGTAIESYVWEDAELDARLETVRTFPGTPTPDEL